MAVGGAALRAVSGQRWYGWTATAVDSAEVDEDLVALDVDYASGGGHIPSAGDVLGVRINDGELRPAVVLYMQAGHIAGILPERYCAASGGYISAEGKAAKLELALRRDISDDMCIAAWDAVDVVAKDPKNASHEAIFRNPPGPSDRKVIDDGLVTGIAAVDAMCPIGRGQSMLVLGREGYGKRDMAKTIVEHSHALNNINGPIVYGASSEAEAKQVEIEIGPGVVERAYTEATTSKTLLHLMLHALFPN